MFEYLFSWVCFTVCFVEVALFCLFGIIGLLIGGYVVRGLTLGGFLDRPCVLFVFGHRVAVSVYD